MWLLSPEKANEFSSAIARGAVPSAQERADYAAAAENAEQAYQAAAQMPRNMRVAGATAEIRVDGILTEKPDLLAWLFGLGNTTYGQIQAGLAVAAADQSIKNVVLDVSSPGGTVAGLFETLAAIEAFPKPITVRASQADSAAYAIAATAGPIEAKTLASEFGSIGVAASFGTDDSVVDITSTDAPNKRPDVSTDEGKAVVREHLDAIHALFVDAIAKGRGTTVKTVNETYGRGSVLLAEEAKARGMVDKIPAPNRARKAAMVAAETEPDAHAEEGGADETEIPQMDIKLLRDQHLEVYEAVRSVGAEEGTKLGIEQGVKQERVRVSAHLTYGEKCGAMDVATKAIREGVEVSHDIIADYMTAGRNKSDVQARQSETDEAKGPGGGAPPAASAASPADLGDQIVELLSGKNGVVK